MIPNTIEFVGKRVEASVGAPPCSAAANEVFDSFHTALNEMVPITKAELVLTGYLSGWMSDLNYKLMELPDYDNSVGHAIRNLVFGYFLSDKRWEFLQHLPLEEPILDFGSGSGFFPAYLSLVTGKRVYSHDLPGAHTKLAARVLPQFDVHPWSGEDVTTIVTYNVLEHFVDPYAQLLTLRKLTPTVYANIDLQINDVQDKALRPSGIRTVTSLREKGHLLPLDGRTSLEESYADLLRRV